MAIGFAKLEFVKRSEGKNSCLKSAYNAKTEMRFHGNCVMKPEVYNFSWKGEPAYHKVLLPSWVDKNFQNPEVLWNAVEKREKIVNSQVAMDLVLALPDDDVISLEDRIALAESFVEKNFISKGLGAQIDIHSPSQMDSDDEGSHNWHAHVLITTRRFHENGLEFEKTKPRDLFPRIMYGRVAFANDNGLLWTQHQNEYFESKGLSLRVDPIGLVPQEHLGPVRMMGRAFDLLEEHTDRLERNALSAADPSRILVKITQYNSVFTKEDVDRFLIKHSPADVIDALREAFWGQKELVPLYDKEGKFLEKYTSSEVVQEERQLLRVFDRIAEKEALRAPNEGVQKMLSSKLTEEQKEAFSAILTGSKASCLQGYAGTGKSYLLHALKTTYEDCGYKVRALGPDNATVSALKKTGFETNENIYRFLFAAHKGLRNIAPSKEVWILDEAGKVGNKPLLELLKLAKANDAQVILSGDSAQLPSIERGGMFKEFCERYGCVSLEDVQRQKVEKHREITKDLAMGDSNAAIDKLVEAKGLIWSENKRKSIEDLMGMWAADTRSFPYSSTLILAHTNAEVNALNEMARIIRKERGEISKEEFACETADSKLYVSVGDRIEFRKNDRELKVTNGLSGRLVNAEVDRFSVAFEEGSKKPRIISFNPQEYHAFRLGYASTYYRSQGQTVDRSYVLYSPHMSKEMFYVGLSRHTKQTFCFVSTGEVASVSDIKHQVSRSSVKSTTLDYVTQTDLDSISSRGKKQADLSRLKESDSVVDRLKGYGLSGWDVISSKAKDFKTRIEDRTPDQQFYNLETSKSERPSSDVSKVNQAHPSVLGLADVAKSIVEREKIVDSSDNKTLAYLQENALCKRVILSLKMKDRPIDEQLRVAHTLWHFEGRSSPGLKKQLSKNIGSSKKDEIVWRFGQECVDFLSKRKDIEGKLGGDVPETRALAYQMLLFEAKYGKEPSASQVEAMREIVKSPSKLAFIEDETAYSKGAMRACSDRITEKLCDQVLFGSKVDTCDINKEKNIMVSFIKEAANYLSFDKTIGLSRDKQLGPSVDRDR